MIPRRVPARYKRFVGPKPIQVATALAAILALAAIASGCGGSSSPGSAEVISPDGAPYSYVVPSGFEEVPGKFPNGEKTPEFFTLVVPEGTEGKGYLNAYEWTLGSDEKRFSTRSLLAFLDEETESFYKSEGASITPGKEETVAGDPAVCWRIGHFKNPTEGFVDADSCAIVAAPGVAVEQSCSWKPATEATMRKGCEELRASLDLSPAEGV